DRPFFGTVIGLIAGGLTLGAISLLCLDRDFKIRTYECTQDVPGLPNGFDEKGFAGIITYRDETQPGSAAKSGKLIRREWLGPISDADRAKLLELSEDSTYRKNIGYLIESTRKLLTPQIVKAAVLLVGVLSILAAFAVAVSTRCNTVWTVLLTLM